MEEIGWEEFAVFGAVLLSSTSIGVYYGCFGGQQTTNDYLLAGRKMNSIPVALSLICSTVSAITLLGYPVEIFLYGTQYMIVVFAYIPLTLSLSYLYIPVYFNLQLSSAYEYIEMRFNSELRTMVSIFAVLHVITSMSIAVYAPALAIELVTGVSTRATTAVISFVCIFYSTLGGLKAVLWADVLQAFIMLLSLAVIAGKGVSDVGGMAEMWDRVEKSGRVQFFNFDPDPRVRHSVWTCLIAGYFFWLPTYASTQLQIQRFLSLPTISRARRTIVINFVGLFIIVGLCFFTGLVILAKYYACDPLVTKEVENSDQLVPYFVKSIVEGFPGLLGLFVSGLTCASMSSLSSGLSALSSITTYDYVNKWFPHFDDRKLSTISKLSCLILGVVTYLFIFVVEVMGNVLPATTALSGLLIGPTLGLFTLGMFYPPTTTKAGLFGMLTTILIMTPYTILQNVYTADLPNQKLPTSTSGCSASNLTSTTPGETYKHHGFDFSQLEDKSHDWKDNDDSAGIRMLSMSYMWYAALTTSLTVFFGIIYTFIHRHYSPKDEQVLKKVNPKCISPPLLTLWKRVWPELMDRLLDSENNSSDSYSKQKLNDNDLKQL